MQAKSIAGALALFLVGCSASVDADEAAEHAAEAISADGAITPSDAKGYIELIKPAWEKSYRNVDGRGLETDCAQVPGWRSSYERYFSTYEHECRHGLRVKKLRPSIDVIYLDFKAKNGEPSRYVFFHGTQVLGEVRDGEALGPGSWFVREGSKMVPYTDAAGEIKAAAPSPREALAREVRREFEFLPNESLAETKCSELHGKAGKTAGAVCYGNSLVLISAKTLARIVRVPDGSDSKYLLVLESGGAIVEVRLNGADFVFYSVDENGKTSKMAD